MKNYLSLFALASLLFFASCAKDTLFEPAVAVSSITKSGHPTPPATNRSTGIEVDVTALSSWQTPGAFLADFYGNYDFSNEILESTQSLQFTDANEELVQLSFKVNSYTGSNDSLQVEFDLGAHNLSGLNLVEEQEIVIEDELIN